MAVFSTSLNRRTFLGGTAAGALTMAFSGSLLAAPKSGGVVTVVSWPPPSYLTSAITTAGPETNLGGKFFDGLLDYGFQMVAQPSLAESWKISDDGLRITFNLRKGVKWHDGQPFTSRDVAFTIMEVLKVHHGRGRVTFGAVTAVETPDENTAVFVLERPAPAMLKSLDAVESPMMPAHLYQGTDIMKNPHNTNPVGTGPYKIESYTVGESVVMVRNPDYWDKDKPHLDRVVMRYVSDSATRTAMLETGEANLVSFSMIPPLDVKRLGEDPKFSVTQKGYETILSMCFIDFNLRNPILANEKVRHAIAHAIDNKWIVENVYFGFGYPATGPLHQEQADFYTAEGVPTYAPDLAQAEKLLDEAGYKRDASGKRFAIVMDPLPWGDEPLRISEYMREQCRQIGIDLTIRTADMAGFVKRVYTNRDFDMSIVVGTSGPDPTIGVHRFYVSSNIKEGVAFSNGSGYSNPEVDKILADAQLELDLEKRKKLYADFQAIEMRDLPSLPLVATNRATVSSANLHDHTVGAIGSFGSLSSAWMDQG